MAPTLAGDLAEQDFQIHPGSEKQVTVESAPGPTHEEIARLAYSLWETRGGKSGSAEEDWFRAASHLGA